MLGISSTSLKICFKGVYGDTINGYITNCKMQKAASLLKNTDKVFLKLQELSATTTAVSLRVLSEG